MWLISNKICGPQVSGEVIWLAIPINDCHTSLLEETKTRQLKRKGEKFLTQSNKKLFGVP
jgi:hypothetical protein